MGRFARILVFASLLGGGILSVQRLFPVETVVPEVSVSLVWLDPIGQDAPSASMPDMAFADGEATGEEGAEASDVSPQSGASPSGDVTPPHPEPAAAVSSPVPEPPAAVLPPPVPLVPDARPAIEPARPLLEAGARPMIVNAKPFTRAGRQPLVAVVVTGLGLSQGATTAAVQDLPGGVTLAYSAYAPRLSEQMERAKVAGHELLLMLPMQSAAETDDAGPDALMLALPESTNLHRLEDVLGRGRGHVGVMPSMGSAFVASPVHFRPILRRISENGLLFAGGAETPALSLRDVAGSLDVPVLLPDVVVDEVLSRKDIDARLAHLVEVARKKGHAIGVAGAYPVTIERLSVWARGLASGKVALAPVSAVFEAQREAR